MGGDILDRPQDVVLLMSSPVGGGGFKVGNVGPGRTGRTSFCYYQVLFSHELDLEDDASLPRAETSGYPGPMAGATGRDP